MIEEKIYSGVDFTTNYLPKSEYELCRFEQCIFSNSDLSNITFNECEFIECDLSLSNIKHTVFNEVSFVKCKLLGLHFNNCDSLFMSMNFDDCNLELASFFDLSLKRTQFKKCNFNGADLTRSDFTQTSFEDCDFKAAIFDGTILDQADLRTAFNFNIDPENNSLKKARFSKENLAGLLLKYQIKIDN